MEYKYDVKHRRWEYYNSIHSNLYKIFINEGHSKTKIWIDSKLKFKYLPIGSILQFVYDMCK